MPPSDLVNDSSPQLGADLDANSNDILMGNQSVKFGTSKWEIVLDTADNDLNFKYNGTTVFKLSSAGAVVAADNITALRNTMTIGTGAVSFDDIRTEFGMSGAISYADLYRGGSNIRAKAANNNGTNLAASVPTSGEISIRKLSRTGTWFSEYTYTGGSSKLPERNAATVWR